MITTPFRAPSARACALTLALASFALVGCGQSADNGAPQSGDNRAASAAPVASSAEFDEAIEDTPCKIIGKATVAATFGVPATEVEQSAYGSQCEYEWESDKEHLNVTVYVTDVYDSAEHAARAFRNATRSMSAQEVAAAKEKVKAQMHKEGKLKNEGEKQAASGIANALGADGFTFTDVEGVGDEARLDTSTGELNVRLGNLRFRVSAFKGASMPIPDKLNSASIMAAHKAWVTKTLEQRKQAAMKLTKAGLEKM